jgi:hypothetical protein
MCIRDRQKKADDLDKKARALASFVARLDIAFGGHAHPKHFSTESAEMVRSRILKRRESDALLAQSFKDLGMNAEALVAISSDAQHNLSAFARHEIGELVRRGEERLSQVCPRGGFSSVLVAVRELYAEDIKDDLLVRDIAKIVADKVFASSKKRA